MGNVAKPHPAIAIILLRADNWYTVHDELFSVAMQASSLICVILTHCDLQPQDYSDEHAAVLSCKPTLASKYNVEVFPVNLVTEEGLQDVLAYIVNACVPSPLPPLLSRGKSRLSQCYSTLLDHVASIFALPGRPTFPDVDDELQQVNASDDIMKLQSSALATSWNDSLKSRLGDPSNPENYGATRITEHLIVKMPRCSEKDSMELIHEHTTIPVPRVHHPHIEEWLITDLVEGVMLFECWDRMSHFMRFRVACTLRLYVKQLRALKSDRVGGVKNGIVEGMLFEMRRHPPFDSVDRFRRFCEHVAFEGWLGFKKANSEFSGEYPCSSTMDWSPAFVHGDLSMTNVILDKNNTLWLIDWGFSGFYPPSFESISMSRNYNLLPKIFPSSWERYRPFIAGSVDQHQHDFFEYFCSSIHRFHTPLSDF